MLDRPSSLREHVDLAPYTTFKIGGPAKYLVEIQRAEELPTVLTWASSQSCPFRVLGAGANVLVADQGYPGLVIIMRNDTLDWEPPLVTVGAGVKNGQLIAGALQHQLGGLQWLIGVPGTIGGSLYGNAGGHGWGLGDFVVWVEAIDQHGRPQRLSRPDGAFAYRTSVFKQHPDWIIARAQLQLLTVDPQVEREVLAATAQQKNRNQPTTAMTAGCMFTNPSAVGGRLPDHLRRHIGPDGSISAWRLIEEVGLKGQRLGQVQISERHANFMINLGGGTADQVLQLISLVKQRVRDTLGLQLREEVQYLGLTTT